MFRTLRKMTAEGKTIIFISHKLEEVLSIADHVSVLRGGRLAATTEAHGKTKAELASLMVGRQVLFQLEKPADHGGRNAAVPQGRRSAGRQVSACAAQGHRSSVHSGEIVGIAGVAGNGQRELAEVICGLRPITHGEISVAGKVVHTASPLAMIEAGVAYVPEDRNGTGSSPNLSIADNIALKAYRTPAHGRGAVIDRKSMRDARDRA